VPIVLCVALLLTGCASHEHPVVGKAYPSQQARDLETERAMQQLREADVAIDYESTDRLFLSVPPGFGHEVIVGLPTLERQVIQCTTNRHLAVVTMDPPMRMLPQTDFDASVDEIEKMLKRIGFHRVVFHLGSAMGRPIYRE
jgi:hypothetical protein